MASEEYQEQPAASQASSLAKLPSALVHQNQKKNNNWWNLILNKIISFIPKFSHKSLSNWSLTGIVSGLIVFLICISLILLPSPSLSDISLELAEVVSTPNLEQEVSKDSSTTEDIEEAVNSSNFSEIESTLVDTNNSETLTTPEKSENLTIQTLAKPILTPEQSLLISVDKKLSKITSQYADGLIVSGEADLLGNRLLIQVSDDWYQLSKSDQDEFANKTLKDSQKFNFKKLQIKDIQNNLIARSPVVGNKMIILQRTN